MKANKVLILIVLLAGLAAAGNNPGGSQTDANAAFSRLKALVGNWEADSPQGKVTASYELVSGGSVLLERDKVPGEGEMITVYHLDGDRLVLTHYCMSGNQPRMVARRFDPSSGELDFAFADASNLKPGAGHMHAASFRLISADRFDSKWNYMEGGQETFSADFHFSRVQ